MQCFASLTKGEKIEPWKFGDLDGEMGWIEYPVTAGQHRVTRVLFKLLEGRWKGDHVVVATDEYSFYELDSDYSDTEANWLPDDIVGCDAFYKCIDISDYAKTCE